MHNRAKISVRALKYWREKKDFNNLLVSKNIIIATDRLLVAKMKMMSLMEGQWALSKVKNISCIHHMP